MTTPALAGVIADVHAGKVETVAYQTKVYALPIYVGPRVVEVDRCVDGIRIWYTRDTGITDDNKNPSILRLKALMQKYYRGKAEVTTDNANCPAYPRVNRIRFTHDGKDGDRAFFDAVERALNDFGFGKVQIQTLKPK